MVQLIATGIIALITIAVMFWLTSLQIKARDESVSTNEVDPVEILKKHTIILKSPIVLALLSLVVICYVLVIDYINAPSQITPSSLYRSLALVSIFVLNVCWLAFSIYLNRRGKTDKLIREYSELYAQLEVKKFEHEHTKEHNQ